nr:hypothetical protein [Tanacetum cinerariifolium]
MDISDEFLGTVAPLIVYWIYSGVLLQQAIQSIVAIILFTDFLGFEDSCSWFCPSITRSSHPQLHFGNPIS